MQCNVFNKEQASRRVWAHAGRMSDLHHTLLERIGGL